VDGLRFGDYTGSVSALSKPSRTAALVADLTGAQRAAVEHGDGPLLVLAGPGSGKTRVITRRAAYLAGTVTTAAHVLAITFTNKAAREMQERIAALDVEAGMTVCTFHAWCARLLRTHSRQAGIAPHFTVLDRDDRRRLVKSAIESAGLSPTHLPVAAVERAIGDAKCEMQTPEAYRASRPGWQEQTCGHVYAEYEKLRVRMEALDFDDLLVSAARLLTEAEQVRGRLEDRYRYVLIDEYQDTNLAQYVIARLLTRDRQNVCATGDPDQSIYGWRGANIRNILTFEKDYPTARVVCLEDNYRSTKRILRVADALIARNCQRKEKSLRTGNAEGPAVVVVECETAEEEAAWVAREIRTLRDQEERGGEVAVFYRVNSLSRAMEDALRKEGLAYQIARGVAFYERREIKDVLAYLRVLVNPADDLSLLRIINTPPRGIGGTTVDRLVNLAREREQPLARLITEEDVLRALGRPAAAVQRFDCLLKELAEALTLAAPRALEYVLSYSGLRALFGRTENMEDAAAGNLDELVSAATLFQHDHPDARLVDWLEYAALVSDVDTVREGAGRVTLMTLHAAKGLEFDTVFIVGMEDGLLPLRRDEEDASDVEEERRLCFVGMTRARRRLVLSRARYRMARGAAIRTVRSGFLDELPRAELEWSCLEDSAPRAGRSAEEQASAERFADWSVGRLVRHPLHGLGQVLALDGGPRSWRAAVLFRDGSRRAFILEHAPLELVAFDEVGD